MTIITRAEKETVETVGSTGGSMEGESVFAQKMREAREKEKKSVKKKTIVPLEPLMQEDAKKEEKSGQEAETPKIVNTEVKRVSLGGIAQNILYNMRYEVTSENGGRNIVSINSSDALRIAEKITNKKIAQEVYSEVASELSQCINGKKLDLQRYYRLIVDRKLLAIGKRLRMLSNGKLYLETIIKKQKK